MQENTLPQKIIRILFVLGALLLALVVIFRIFNFLSMATLVVSTKNPDGLVTITPIKNGQKNNSAFKQAKHQLKLRVSPGSYEIDASYKSSTVSQIVTIKSRQSASYTLTPIMASSPEPVYGNSVDGVTADASHINFIDIDNGNLLSSIGADNNVTVLYPIEPLYGAKWASTSLGLAHNHDNEVFVIHGAAVDKLNLPFSPPKNSNSLSYAIASDGTIYVSNGSAIYKGAIGGGFSKIYTSQGLVFGLSASPKTVTAIESADKNIQDPEGSLIIVSDSGQVRRPNIKTSAALQSPDGKYFVAESDSGLLVYSSPSMSFVTLLPSSSTNSYSWGTNDNLFYNQSESLWLYGANSHQSNKLAVTPGKSNILGIYPTPDNSYVYLTTASTNPNADSGASQLFRVPLKGQAEHNSILGVSVFMPETINGGVSGYCRLNYINFTSPTITVFYSGSAYANSGEFCTQITQGEIQTYYLIPSDFQFKVMPSAAE